MNIRELANKHLDGYKVDGGIIAIKKCPFCGNTEYSFHYELKSSVFICSNCEESGDIDEIKSIFGIEEIESQTMTDKKINKSKLKGVSKLEDLDKNIKDSISRYITKDYIYDKENIIITDNGNKIIFLHKTSEGKLKGIRTIQKEGKSLNVEYKSDCLNTLYNADGVDGDNLIVTIGEFDALFLLSQGIENVVAIAKKDNLDFIREHYDFLQSKNKIKFIVSNKKIDDKTYIEKYGNELINRLGKDKVSLLEYNKEDLVEEYNNLNLELIEGISSVKKNIKIKNLMAFEDVEEEDKQIISCCIPAINGLCGGIQLGGITGILAESGSGKSTLTNQLLCNMVDNDEQVVIFSGEDSPSDLKNRILNTFAGKSNLDIKANPFSPNRLTVKVKDENIKKAISDSISDKIDFFKYNIVADSEDLLQAIEDSYKRKGTRIFYLDNLMNISYNKGNIGNDNNKEIEFVLLLAEICRRLPIHVFIVLHPKKLAKGESLDKYSIRGASEITNVLSELLALRKLTEDEIEDRLLKDQGEASLEIKLLKDRRFGLEGRFTYMNYSKTTGRLFSVNGTDDYKYKWQIEYEKKLKKGDL